jgi:integrase
VLTEHRRATWPEGYVFGRGPEQLFAATTLTDRADKAWEEAELDRITLHEARHSYAFVMIAAGVNAKALSEFMGHSSIQVTLDLHGHLFPVSSKKQRASSMRYSKTPRAKPVAETQRPRLVPTVVPTRPR